MSQLIPANLGFLATTPPPGFSVPVIGISVLFLALCLSSLWCVHRLTKSCWKRKRHYSPDTSPEDKQSGLGERVEVQPSPFLFRLGSLLRSMGGPTDIELGTFIAAPRVADWAQLAGTTVAPG